MIPRTPHLTQGHDPALAAQIAKTRPGMAHWAGSGPLGRVCAECAHLGYEQQVLNAIGVVAATERRYGCAKFLRLTGRHGPIVPKSAAACRHFEPRDDTAACANAAPLSPEADHAP
jgi:hypothetical protein